jgi:hypothetical protein
MTVWDVHKPIPPLCGNRTCFEIGSRRIRKGTRVDDAKLVGLIVSMILEHPTRLRCISAKINATRLDTVRAVKRIVGTVPVEMRVGERCRVCGSTLDPVYLAARR